MTERKRMQPTWSHLGSVIFLLGGALMIPLFAEEEPLLPLPGQQSPRNTMTTTTPADPEVIIPLPGQTRSVASATKKTMVVPKKTHKDEILPIPHEPTESPNFSNPPLSPDNTTIIITPTEPGAASEPTIVVNAAPPAMANPPQTQETGSAAPAGNKPKSVLPAYPKDTSSAVFMLMKSWECEKYDGSTLLTHSIGVYGQEAEDKFEVKGVEDLPKFEVTLKEDDVTLDELLDILANKHGFDWGVDIPGKTVYIYSNAK